MPLDGAGISMSDNVNSKRDAIPAELRRKVLIEAGHRCSIPTCRETEIDIHHITPWEECKTHEFENLIALCPNCHRRAHKKEIDKKALRQYKANLSKNNAINTSTYSHGTVSSGTVVLRRTEGKIHLLTVAGNISITTADWPSVADSLILKITNGGMHTITWEGFNSLPFAHGFTFTANGTDLVELNYYDGDVFFKSIHNAIQVG